MARARASSKAAEPAAEVSDVDLESFAGDAAVDELAEAGLDSFRELFEGAPEDKVRVVLRRVTPESWTDPITGEPVPIRGYCEQLPPGLPDYEGYIKVRYGGGTFFVSKMVNGVYRANRKLQIAGAPVVNSPRQGAVQTGAERALSGDSTVVEGVPIGGDDTAFERRMERVLAIKKLFEPAPAAPDINAVLLQYVLTQAGGSNPLESFRTYTEILEAAKGLAGGDGGGGGDLMGVVSQALQLLGRLPARGGARAPGAGTAGRPALQPQLPDQSQPVAEKGEQQPMTFDPRALLYQALEKVAEHYCFEPPTPPAEVVEMLDLIAPLPVEKRGAFVGPVQRGLMNLGKSTVAELLSERENAAELVAGWPEYFNQVLQLWCEPSRTPVEVKL